MAQQLLKRENVPAVHNEMTGKGMSQNMGRLVCGYAQRPFDHWGRCRSIQQLNTIA